MELDICIKERRSMRSFQDRDIRWEDIATILESARWAPSAGNIQNWAFVVVKDKKHIEQLAKASLNQLWMTEANVVIVVCSRMERIKSVYGVRGEVLYATQNCALAVQNMLLTAHSLGLSTCVVGAFDEEAVASAIKIKVGDIRPQLLVAVGYGKEEPGRAPIPRRDSLENLVFFEEWECVKKDPKLWGAPRKLEVAKKGLKKKISKGLEKIKKRKKKTAKK